MTQDENDHRRPLTRDEAAFLIERFAKLDAEIKVEESRRDAPAGLRDFVDRAEKFIKYAWAFGAIIAAITLWVGKMQWDAAQRTVEINKHETRLEQLDTKIEVIRESIREWRSADQRFFDTLKNSIEANRAERMNDLKVIRDDVAALKADAPKVTEMWLMQRLGRSNKEEFQRRNGYPAPAPNDAANP